MTIPIRQRLAGILNRQLGRLGYALIRTDSGRQVPPPNPDAEAYGYENPQLLAIYAPWLGDAPFLDVWREAAPNTLTDIFRSYELWNCVREVAGIPGDILEVGVWRGGTGAVLAAAARRWKPAARVWLCDTFSGVVKAGDFDPSYQGGEHADTSVELVRALMSRLRLDNVDIQQGVFPDATGPALGSSGIALCHVDVDVYQSAADVVAWAKPRMAPGAMLVFDDYGFESCQGITRLVDELRSGGDWVYFYNLNKHAILVRR